MLNAGLKTYFHENFYCNRSYDRPKLITALSGLEVVAIACGGAHSACLTARGRVYTWGKGRYGRLGHGDSEDQLLPKLVSYILLHMLIGVKMANEKIFLEWRLTRSRERHSVRWKNNIVQLARQYWILIPHDMSKIGCKRGCYDDFNIFNKFVLDIFFCM